MDKALPERSRSTLEPKERRAWIVLIAMIVFFVTGTAAAFAGAIVRSEACIYIGIGVAMTSMAAIFIAAVFLPDSAKR